MPEAIRIFRTLEQARNCFGPSALSIGNFDGVHLGHQSILRETVELATSRGWNPSVLTFDPHPTLVVAPERAPRLLSSIAQRCRWLQECGITQVLVLPFTQEVAQLSPEAFVRQILVEVLDARAVFVGENFRFGRRQAGDAQLLQALGAELGFEVRVMPAVRLRGRVISSSAIRKCILAGEVAWAARMLGRFYGLEGEVVRGRGVGARLTVPTLNLATTAEVLPAVGVYVSRAIDMQSEHRWAAVTNIGHRPSFGGGQLSIETHLIEPLEGEAPKAIRVEVTHRLREERRFASPEALKEQILIDIRRAKAWHRRWNRWRVQAPQPAPARSLY